MTVKELYERLCLTFPTRLSCPWDNDGLMVCPDPARRVGRVLVTLDVTRAAVEHAIDAGADVILSHHPLLFHPLSALSADDPIAAKALRAAAAGISVMCFHTRADAAPGGVSDLLAEALGLSNIETLGEEGILRAGNLPHPLSAAALAEQVKGVLGTPGVTVADAGRPIRWLAVCGGEGKDMAELARQSGCDALLTGRIGYHAMLDGAETGMTLLEAGHYYTEAPVLSLFARLVGEACGAAVTEHREPPVTLY